MGNEIFPTLAGLKWDQKKTPIFSTLMQRSTSKKETRLSLFVYPLYQYDLSYEILRDDILNNELKTIMGFYLARQGAFDSFLYLDPSDNTVVGQVIATGNGSLKSFQMGRTYGGFYEPRYRIAVPASPTPILKIYLNASLQSSGYTVDTYTGLLTFANAPGSGVVITADFTYYQQVRFVEYVEDGSPGGGGSAFSTFAHNLWELQGLSFVTCR